MDVRATEQCSYCHDGTERMPDGSGREYDCPRRNCPRCGREYYDGCFVEPAIHFYELEPERPEILSWLVSSAIAVVVEVLLLIRGGLADLPIPTVVFGAITVSLLIKTHRRLYPYLRREEYNRKFHEDRLGYLRGEKALPQSLAQSLKRLSDEEYLYYLIAHGANVPDFFFHRIGLAPDCARVEELDQQRQARAELRARKEKVCRLRDELEYYTELLSHGLDDTAFKTQAKMHGMTPDMFAEHCHSLVGSTRRELETTMATEE